MTLSRRNTMTTMSRLTASLSIILLVFVVIVVTLLLQQYQSHHRTTTANQGKKGRCDCAKPKPSSPPPPLKVFLLAGQSNMQGHGYIDSKNQTTGKPLNGTLEWLVEHDPDEYGMLLWLQQQQQQPQQPQQQSNTKNWTERQDVWIAYNEQLIGDVRPEIRKHGVLLPGYGGRDESQFHMGPELGFGWTLAQALNGEKNKENDKKDKKTTKTIIINDDDDDDSDNGDNMDCPYPSHHHHHYHPKKQQILLLKIAWGGRSLAVDFRPPSSGNTTGLYYTSMLATVFKTLENLHDLFPDYNANAGSSYELSGFVWHQGWNDGCDQAMTDEYEFNLANLIRDIRIDLGVPNLPVSIGVSGMMGYQNYSEYYDKDYEKNDTAASGSSIDTDDYSHLDRPDPKRDAIITAQFAMMNATKYPEFVGTVEAVETRGYARDAAPHSPSTQGYHWNSNCESYWLVGKAMAEAMLRLMSTMKELEMNRMNDDGDSSTSTATTTANTAATTTT